jgi:ABC-type branched-subunit amino acid transport system substrate-binding protein
VVREYQDAIAKQLGKKDFSFTSLEAYISAKIAVEALKRAGPRLTRESFMQALDGMKQVDMGGYMVNFSPSNHNGSTQVEMTVIGRNLQFNY